MAAISESPITPEERDYIGRAAAVVAEALELDAMESPPVELVRAINAQVCRSQRKGATDGLDPWSDLSIPLGCLWGEQMVREFGWEWVNVTFRDPHDEALGVCSPDRSLAVYPPRFVFDCIQNQAVVTILPAFNMLKDGTVIPKLPADGYADVMEHVHYVVPPA